MSEVLTVGISTCPNDTFAFSGLLNRRVEVPGFELKFELLDVQTLNEAMASQRFDFVKASFAAALRWVDDYLVLPVGAALGHGVGPVLLGQGADKGKAPALERSKILVPGAGTTAAFLMRRLHPEAAEASSVVFSEIMPALQRGEVDYGVCIHEGRFTYQENGLRLVEDLGESWRRHTNQKLPLGGIFGRRSLAVGTHAAVTDGIQRSIDHAREHHDEAETQMARYAQELDSPALWKHVELYVNDDTRELSVDGRRALKVFAKEAEGDPVLDGRGSFEIFSN